MIKCIKARIFAKKFNIWTKKIDPKRKNDRRGIGFNDGYFIYKGIIYYGNRFGVFFKSNFQIK
jgi:hypothetical protein